MTETRNRKPHLTNRAYIRSLLLRMTNELHHHTYTRVSGRLLEEVELLVYSWAKKKASEQISKGKTVA